MRAVDPARAIVFDRLSSYSYGYGGDPINVTYLKSRRDAFTTSAQVIADIVNTSITTCWLIR